MAHKILVVEDNPTDQQTLKKLLESKGYMVSVAGSFSTSRKLMYEDEFELGIVDLVLKEEPDLEGIAVLEEMKKKRLVFIVLSAYLNNSTASWLWDHFERFGLCDALAKPEKTIDELIFRNKLIAAVQDALETALQIRNADGVSERQDKYIRDALKDFQRYLGR